MRLRDGLNILANLWGSHLNNNFNIDGQKEKVIRTLYILENMLI